MRCFAALDGSADLPPDQDLTFACPRCETDVAEHWYGPCDACRVALRASVRGTARDVDAEYEPKMNVTPNAVALKE